MRAHPRSASIGNKVLSALLARKHTLLLSNEIISETIRVLRYPRLRKLWALTDGELYDYAQFLRNVSQKVVLREPYHAPLRDTNDLNVMQTAEHGDAEVLCTNDTDFLEDSVVLAFCAVRGITVCTEAALLARID